MMHHRNHTRQEAGTHHHHGGGLQTEGRTISWARLYDPFVRVLFASGAQTMREATVRLAAIQPGEKVLDVGCGTGTVAILAKQGAGRDAEIYGTDAAPEMIERARAKARRAKVTVDFQPGLAEKIQFPENSFDLVMNSLMMHHLTAGLRRKAIAEMYRVLKPGGRLLIIDFEPPQEGMTRRLLAVILGDMIAIDNRTVPPLLKEAGFADVQIGPTESRIATYISGVKPLS